MFNRRMLITGLLGGAATALMQPAAVRSATQPTAKSGSSFPNMSLITHEGKPVRFYDDLLRGKTVLINMMYAQCEGICPGMTANLSRVQKALGDQVGRTVFMYSLTLQPDQDTPAVLADYVQMHRIRPGWKFLTGNRADIEAVRGSLGFFDRDPAIDGDKTQHTGMVLLGNDALNRWCSTPAMREPEQIVAAIRMMNRLISVGNNVLPTKETIHDRRA